MQGRGLISAVVLRKCSQGVSYSITYNYNSKVHHKLKCGVKWMK